MESKRSALVTKSLNAYAQELREWMTLTRQCQMTNYYYQMTVFNSAVNTMSASRDSNSNLVTSFGSPGIQPNLNPPRTFPVTAGTEVSIPTVWKRCAAEVIDCIILVVVKLMISYVLINVGGFKAADILDFDYALITGEIDLEKFYSLSADIMLVEFIHRLFVSMYEAVCLAYVTNVIPPGGFTLGKKLMGLAVVSCDEVFSLGNGRFLVTDIKNPSLGSTFCRSLIKNFSLSLMMPSCLTIFMFDHRRTVYDIVTGTVVIESR